VSSNERPAGVAQAHPALVEMLESLLAEVPEAAPAVPAAAPQADASDSNETALKETHPPPLQAARECRVYGAEASTLDAPESRFSAILFTVGRYKFAVPLNMLDSVTRVVERPTAIFGQPDWHRGVTVNRSQQMVLVDAGRLLGLADAEPPESAEHVLVLPGGRYGILSSNPPEPVTLRGGGIRWSRYDPRRAWMAAILPEHMCVMLDVEELTSLM
jgi:chemotaxis signal transduction protein